MDKILSVFKALSDRNRLRIYMALVNHNELCACQIVELLQVTGATASRHLNQLTQAGLLKSRKDGRWVNYSLENNSHNFSIVRKWINSQLRQSETYLNDLQVLKKITSINREVLCKKQRNDETDRS